MYPNHRRGQGRVKVGEKAVVVEFDVEAAFRCHLVRQLTDKVAATASNCTTTRKSGSAACWAESLRLSGADGLPSTLGSTGRLIHLADLRSSPRWKPPRKGQEVVSKSDGSDGHIPLRIQIPPTLALHGDSRHRGEAPPVLPQGSRTLCSSARQCCACFDGFPISRPTGLFPTF